MRITGPDKSRQTAASKSAGKAKGTGASFALPSTAEAGGQSATQAAGATSSVQGVDALLALQSVDDALSAPRRAVMHGNRLLDQLEQLKVDLLSGQVAPARLARLRSQLSQRQASGNSELDSLIDAIELRVEVELAKLSR